jgi:hypothetical protein
MPGLFLKHLPNEVADARQPVMPGLFPKHLPNKKLLMHGNLPLPACFPNI